MPSRLVSDGGGHRQDSPAPARDVVAPAQGQLAPPKDQDVPEPEESGRYLGTSAALRREMSPFFDTPWFLGRNLDVRDSGLDALAHYLVQGFREDRNPSPYFDTAHYRRQHMGTDVSCPLVHYVRVGRFKGLSPHPLIDPLHVAKTHGVPSEQLLATLIARTSDIDSLSEWFSRTLYSQLHPDVTGDPFEHFATAGFAERRRPHPGFLITADGTGDVVYVHRKVGAQSCYVVRNSVPPAIVDQIMAQGLLDPMVFAPGHETLPFLVQRRSTSVIEREGFDQRALMDAIGRRPDVVVLHPGLCVGGAEKYMAQMVQCLDREMRLRPLVMTTLATAEADREALSLDILRPLRSVQVLSLRPHIGRARDPVLTLALLLLALRPKHVFVINSELGLQAIREYGRVLSSAMRLYVSFFSESPFARGAPYATRYLFDVIPHARVFADNSAVLNALSGRLGDQVKERFLLIPQSVDIPSDHRFEARLRARRRAGSSPPQVLWVSRWSLAKATDVLEQLAVLRPDVSIDAYGVHEEAQFPSLPNLHRHPVMLNLDGLRLERYDAFIFTSYFEGMPNVVLEFAARGIPIIASDVGGIRETLDDRSVDYVQMSDRNATRTAQMFSSALDAVRARSEQETLERLRRARASVAARHSISALAKSLGEAIR